VPPYSQRQNCGEAWQLLCEAGGHSQAASLDRSFSTVAASLPLDLTNAGHPPRLLALAAPYIPLGVAWAAMRTLILKELCKFLFGAMALQASLFAAARLTYRRRAGGLAHRLIGFGVFAFAFIASDKDDLRAMFATHDPVKAVVLVCDFLIMGPCLGLAFYKLDYHWGLHWSKKADDRDRVLGLP